MQARPQRLGVGILGAGGIARLRHVPGFQQSGVADVVAVYDPVTEAAERVAELCGATVMASPKALLARDDVAAVSVCTPNVLHAPLSLAAIHAGKHVLCEKPLGMTYNQTREMEREAQRAGVTTAVNFRYRYLPAVQLLKRQIAEGLFGRPYHVLFHYLQGNLIDPTRPVNWRLDRAMAGSGTLGDLASHGIDLVRYLFGEITAVFADLTTFVPERPTGDGERAAVDVDDACTLLLRLSSGGMATVEATRNAGGRSNYQRLDYYGETGSAYYEMDRADQGADRLHVWRPDGDEFVAEQAPPDLPTSNTQIISDFAHAAVRGRQMSPSFTDGVRCQQVLSAAEASSAQGAWIALS